WGAQARHTWSVISNRKFIAGLFVWTGFDYRGEPSPHSWPCVNSHFGIMDTCGFAKDSFYLHKAWFTPQPFVHLLPHWTWPGRDGELVRVITYSNCDSVELFVNGTSAGRFKVNPFEMNEWSVGYAPGELKAVGYRDDTSVECIVET